MPESEVNLMRLMVNIIGVAGVIELLGAVFFWLTQGQSEDPEADGFIATCINLPVGLVCVGTWYAARQPEAAQKALLALVVAGFAAWLIICAIRRAEERGRRAAQSPRRPLPSERRHPEARPRGARR